MSFPYAICTDPDARRVCATCRYNPANQNDSHAGGKSQKPDLTDTGCRSWDAVAESLREPRP